MSNSTVLTFPSSDRCVRARECNERLVFMFIPQRCLLFRREMRVLVLSSVCFLGQNRASFVVWWRSPLSHFDVSALTLNVVPGRCYGAVGSRRWCGRGYFERGQQRPGVYWQRPSQVEAVDQSTHFLRLQRGKKSDDQKTNGGYSLAHCFWLDN